MRIPVVSAATLKTVLSTFGDIAVADSRAELIQTMIDEDGLDSDETEQVLDSLEKMHATHDRMIDIIEDVLTLAREGKTVEETEPLSLQAVAEDAWANVDTKDATLAVRADQTIRADRSKLLTIFENLVRNALDHGPEDATLEVGPIDDGFYIQDDGPGIPEEHHDSIFEYGYTTSQEGTGLGLSIVRTMAESHGWAVTHDEGYDDGTRFVFHIAGNSTSDRENEPALAR
jgi:signal transduction histidine kinase